MPAGFKDFGEDCAIIRGREMTDFAECVNSMKLE